MRKRGASEPRPGALWHGYQVEQVIARPHDRVKFSTAYCARTEAGVPIVIKVFHLNPKMSATTVARARESFEYERRALLALEHPAIPRLLAADFAGPRPILVLARMPGDDLRHAPALARPAVLRAAQELAAAVAHVHASGWAHQDIRPDHVLVQAHGAVSLIDFGQARSLTAAGARHDLQALGAIVMMLAASPILARNPAALMPGGGIEGRFLGLLTADPQGAAAFGRDPLIAAAARCRAGELDAAGLEQAIADIEAPPSDLGRWLSTILDALPETVS